MNKLAIGTVLAAGAVLAACGAGQQDQGIPEEITEFSNFVSQQVAKQDNVFYWDQDEDNNNIPDALEAFKAAGEGSEIVFIHESPECSACKAYGAEIFNSISSGELSLVSPENGDLEILASNSTTFVIVPQSLSNNGIVPSALLSAFYNNEDQSSVKINQRFYENNQEWIETVFDNHPNFFPGFSVSSDLESFQTYGYAPKPN